MDASHYPFANYLIDTLPNETKNRLLPHLKLIELPAGKVLFDANEKESVVFFPINCIIALTYVTRNGVTGEIALVGNEGMVGIPTVLGGESTTSRSVVLSGGYAYRLPSQLLKDEFKPCGEFQTLILRYLLALITQVTQMAVCSRHHSINHRLCCLLLLSLDRSQSNQLTMTQEIIATMLGVRRESVSEAAGLLQKLGVIEYKRGHITVLDRTKLEEHCCECYFVVANETKRLLPRPEHNETEGLCVFRSVRPRVPASSGHREPALV